jgi:hypothetical protein
MNVHLSQKLETTKMSTDRWMDTQIVIDLSNGILLSNKKERTTDMCNKMHESQNNCAEWKKLSFSPQNSDSWMRPSI